MNTFDEIAVTPATEIVGTWAGRFGMETVGVQPRLIMIEVSGSINQSYVNVGSNLYRHQTDALILHIVHEGPGGSPTDTDSQMRQRFASILSKPNTSLVVDVRTENVTLTAHRPDVIVMGMRQGEKRIGPDIQATVNLSNTSLLVVKRMALTTTNKIYFLGVDGGPMSSACLHKLARLLNPNDEVIAVIISKTEGEKDKKVLETMDAMMTEARVKKHRAVFIARDMAVTTGQQLLSTANHMEADVIVCATGKNAMLRSGLRYASLGRTSTHLLLNATQHVLLLKVPTFFSSDNLECLGLKEDALYQ